MRNAFVLIIAVVLIAVAEGRQHRTKEKPPTPVVQVTDRHFTGFSDIAWGDSPGMAKEKLLKRTGASFAGESSSLLFRGGTFLNHPVDSWSLDFWQNNYFFFARVRFHHDDVSRQALINDLQQALTAEYGKPSWPNRWSFRNQGSDMPNVVSLVCAPGLPVEICYGGHGFADSLSHHQF